nr:hypothetical protein [uncultured Pseudomonas sp.]
MTDIHDRGRAMAIRMLAPRPKGKGMALVLTQATVGTYDPVAGGSVIGSKAYNGSGLRYSYTQDEVDGTAIQQGDVKLLVSPVQLAGADLPKPATGDTVRFDGVLYRVINVEAWNFAGVDCGYEVQGRA